AAWASPRRETAPSHAVVTGKEGKVGGYWRRPTGVKAGPRTDFRYRPARSSATVSLARPRGTAWEDRPTRSASTPILGLRPFAGVLWEKPSCLLHQPRCPV